MWKSVCVPGLQSAFFSDRINVHSLFELWTFSHLFWIVLLISIQRPGYTWQASFHSLSNQFVAMRFPTVAKSCSFQKKYWEKNLFKGKSYRRGIRSEVSALTYQWHRRTGTQSRNTERGHRQCTNLQGFNIHFNLFNVECHNIWQNVKSLRVRPSRVSFLWW